MNSKTNLFAAKDNTHFISFRFCESITILFLNICLFAFAGHAKADQDIIFVQAKADRVNDDQGIYVESTHIAYLQSNADTPVNLTPEFYAAADPELSFDGKTILFAGKKTRDAYWQIWQMKVNGSAKKQISAMERDCFMPLFAGSRFYLNDPQPTPQIIFVTAPEGQKKSLFAMDREGKNVHRLTFNIHDDTEPDILPNGRIVYSSWQPYWQGNQFSGKYTFMAVNNDGTDVMPFYGNHEPPLYKNKIHVSKTDYRIYFIEADRKNLLGGGNLSSLSRKRPLNSYRRITPAKSGFFHSPVALPDGSLLASYCADEYSVYAIYDVDPESGQLLDLVFSLPDWHALDCQLVRQRAVVKGRSNWLIPGSETGIFYCINSYRTNLDEIATIETGSVHSVRITEAIQFTDSKTAQIPPRRILGTAPVHQDGSFQVKVPAGVPLNFQLLDINGMAISKQESWIWVIGNENRGCIGCHEDRELSPPNVLSEAITKPAVDLDIPVQQRRVIDFVHDIAPIVKAKCSDTGCHGTINKKSNPPGYDNRDLPGMYQKLMDENVVAGWAIRSKLITDIINHQAMDQSPATLPHPVVSLSEAERMRVIEWIDLGAFFDLNRNLSEQE